MIKRIFSKSDALKVKKYEMEIKEILKKEERKKKYFRAKNLNGIKMHTFYEKNILYIYI